MHKVFPHIKTGASQPAQAPAEAAPEVVATIDADATPDAEVAADALERRHRARKRNSLVETQTVERRTVEAQLAEAQSVEAQPVDPLTQSHWFRFGRSISRSIQTTRRRVHAQIIKSTLTSELWSRRAVNATLSKATIVSATLLSIFITVAFLILADSQNMKASEASLHLSDFSARNAPRLRIIDDR